MSSRYSETQMGYICVMQSIMLNCSSLVWKGLAHFRADKLDALSDSWVTRSLACSAHPFSTMVSTHGISWDEHLSMVLWEYLKYKMWRKRNTRVSASSRCNGNIILTTFFVTSRSRSTDTGSAVNVIKMATFPFQCTLALMSSHDDVIKWKHFPRHWPFVRGIHRSPVNSPHKGQWRGALMFSLICAWTDGWVNNGYVGDLRRHCAHCDVSVMECLFTPLQMCMTWLGSRSPGPQPTSPPSSGPSAWRNMRVRSRARPSNTLSSCRSWTGTRRKQVTSSGSLYLLFQVTWKWAQPMMLHVINFSLIVWDRSHVTW